ncbi:hypothetical protein HNR42_003123 [Deinobacterium chartae]|uniref:Uncharacterized protein n=1 Tax=Deinobacterium chartae TaxID=521158 RepID=A0A841I767_9DEIO|nr:hypothetical protein [Deinobacterium chartae]MBB6099665.1 hypothetical protein [Deinobacterium chartae]
MEDFLETIRPYGSEYVIQLYLLRNQFDSEKIGISALFGDCQDVSVSDITGDLWPAKVILVEIYYDSPPSDIEVRLNSQLEVSKGESVACWYMLEGAFDVTSLDSDWSSRNIYGFAFDDQPSIINIEIEQRSLRSWSDSVRSMAVYIYDKFPALKFIE